MSRFEQTLTKVISQGKLTTAISLMKTASASDLASVSDFEKILTLTVKADDTAAQKATLAQLIVAKATIDGVTLGAVLNNFMAQKNISALEAMLKAADKEEWQSIPAKTLGHLLVKIAYTDQTALLKLIMIHGTVDGGSLGQALTHTLEGKNFKGFESIINGASPAELKSISAADYKTMLTTITDSKDMSAHDQSAMAQLIVGKAELNSLALNLPLNKALMYYNYDLISDMMDSMSTSELIIVKNQIKALSDAGFQSESDRITGSAHADAIFGFNGDDKIYGLAGDDRLYGGAGNDKLYGGDGNDVLSAGAGQDYVDGGAGKDTLIMEFNYKDVIVEFENSLNVDFLIRANDGSVTKFVNVEQVAFNDMTMAVTMNGSLELLHVTPVVQG